MTYGLVKTGWVKTHWLGDWVTAVVICALIFAVGSEERGPQIFSGHWSLYEISCFIEHCKGIINPLDKLGGSHRPIRIGRHGEEAARSLLRGFADAGKI